MSSTTSIEWTQNADGTAGKTWNPVRGCSMVSPGCVNCYAMKQAHRFSGPGLAYEGLTKQTKAGPQWTGVVRTVESALLEPLSWRKPQRVFVNSMSDLFHESVPDIFIGRVFDVMGRAAQHTFQVLTKRPERMREFVTYYYDVLRLRHLRPFPNVWLGVSCENQRFADERIPFLLDTPAAVRFISAEPLLGPIDARPAWNRGLPWLRHDGVSWVIVGGESGPGARPLDVAWARSIVDQCKAAGVACFVKQLGAVPVANCSQCGRSVGHVQGGYVDPCGPTHAALIAESMRIRNGKGGDPSEWAEDLRVREFPTAALVEANKR